jgi:hypothetical protein
MPVPAKYQGLFKYQAHRTQRQVKTPMKYQKKSNDRWEHKGYRQKKKYPTYKKTTHARTNYAR